MLPALINEHCNSLTTPDQSLYVCMEFRVADHPGGEGPDPVPTLEKYRIRQARKTGSGCDPRKKKPGSDRQEKLDQDPDAVIDKKKPRRRSQPDENSLVNIT